MNPCGHRTRHTDRLSCCSGCHIMFTSGSAFDKHRRNMRCLTPAEAGLIARPSKTAPGEVLYSLPGPDIHQGEDQ